MIETIVKFTEQSLYTMKLTPRLSVLIITVLLVNCGADVSQDSLRYEAFQQDVLSLQQRLGIPGLAGVIVQDGSVVHSFSNGIIEAEPDQPFTTNTPLQVASITKSLTAVLVMQAAERGELSYDDDISQYEPDYDRYLSPYEPQPGGPEDISIRHVVAHTSEGQPGQRFVYSPFKYNLLARLLEKATGQGFDVLIRTRILEPAGMTEFDSPDLWASYGLVTTANELAKFAVALDREVLLSAERQRQICQPLESTDGKVLPVGLGWFSQEFLGQQICWSYGQNPDVKETSALFLRVPGKKLSLFLVADTQLLSDPFRLLMADLRRSPFAMSFLRSMVGGQTGDPIPTPDWTQDIAALSDQLETLETRHQYSYRDDLIDEFLVRIQQHRSDATEMAAFLFSKYPDLRDSEDAALLFTLRGLDDPQFLSAAIHIGENLLETSPLNRWHLFMLAGAYGMAGETGKAMALHERILALPNQNSDPLFRSLFMATSLQALAGYWLDRDPEKAKAHLEHILGLNVGESRDAVARAMLEELEGAIDQSRT